MASVYTVSQVNGYIKRMIDQDYLLEKIYVKGEVSNCKYHTAGHIYFTLKDENANVISAVMFAGNRSGLKFRMTEGQKVIVFGKVSVYERDGKYQLYAREINLEGTGLLYQRFEQLKIELAEMGLFDPMYKKPIPKYALKVGICTAQTGAAIQDIINIATRRNPYVQLYLYPSLVQGAGAAEDIVNGIRCLDRMNLDVIIIGRGGGSIEDLWAFNEEIVARAIFDCNTPIISAVGHETDTTISDFVADKRVPTPSAAAELAVFDYNEFVQKQLINKQLLMTNMSHILDKFRSYTRQLETNLKLCSPTNQLLNKKQYAADVAVRLSECFDRVLKERKHHLAICAEKLEGLSPLNRISKGFAYVTDQEGKPINSVKQLNEGQDISLIVRDGQVDAKVINVREQNRV